MPLSCIIRTTPRLLGCFGDMELVTLQNFILYKERRISRSRSPEPRSWRREDDYDYDYTRGSDSRRNGSSTRDTETRPRSDRASVNYPSHRYREPDALSSFREKMLSGGRKDGSRYSTDSGLDIVSRHGDGESRHKVRGVFEIILVL
jgi:hypothetical protein